MLVSGSVVNLNFCCGCLSKEYYDTDVTMAIFGTPSLCGLFWADFTDALWERGLFGQPQWLALSQAIWIDNVPLWNWMLTLQEHEEITCIYIDTYSK